MRPDQSSASAAAEAAHARQYANRWKAVECWAIMALQGDHSTERIDGMRSRHRTRLLLLHQSLRIPMNIIRRWMLDDPRLTEPQMRERLTDYRRRQQVYDSMKRKRSSNADKQGSGSTAPAAE